MVRIDRQLGSLDGLQDDDTHGALSDPYKTEAAGDQGREGDGSGRLELDHLGAGQSRAGSIELASSGEAE